MTPADGWRLLDEQPVPGLTLAHVGECVADGFWLEEAGARRPLEPRGYVHRLT